MEQHKSVRTLLSTNWWNEHYKVQKILVWQNRNKKWWQCTTIYSFFVASYHALHIVGYVSVSRQKHLLWWLKLFLLPNLSCNTVKISTTLNSQPTATITRLLNKFQLLKRLQCLTGYTTCTSAEMWWTHTISLTSWNDNVHCVAFLTSIRYLIRRKSHHANTLIHSLTIHLIPITTHTWIKTKNMTFKTDVWEDCPTGNERFRHDW